MFGLTKCGKCEGTSFKLQEMSPVGSAYKFFAVQCSSCQTPIGVTDYYNIGQLLKNQEKTIASLEQKLSHIEDSLNQIAHVLNHIR